MLGATDRKSLRDGHVVGLSLNMRFVELHFQFMFVREIILQISDTPHIDLIRLRFKGN